MEDCKFRYDNQNKWLLQGMTLNVSYRSRITIIGKNGAGKSTLLKLLCGELSVNKGEMHTHPNLKIAYIAQHHIEQLASYLESTPVEYFMQHHKAKDAQEARKFLRDFGLVGPWALQQIGMSGGQKARLGFATTTQDYTESHTTTVGRPEYSRRCCPRLTQHSIVSAHTQRTVRFPVMRLRFLCSTNATVVLVPTNWV